MIRFFERQAKYNSRIKKTYYFPIKMMCLKYRKNLLHYGV